jgi:serine/threonine protein kinase/WD40 repeat protein
MNPQALLSPPGREPAGAPNAHLAGLMAEFRRLWEAGGPVRVEEFLARDPALQLGEESVLDLLYQECILREERGEHPAADEYVRRFPTLEKSLRQQFALDQILASQGRPPNPAADTSWPATIGGGLVPEVPPTVPSFSAAPADVRVPGYEVLEVLGRGGMGVVYKARQVKLNRLVALKMILAGAHAGAEERKRFQAEAEAVARLAHPNIVQIYEVGEHDGLPYLALEYCPGGSLDKKLDGTPLPSAHAARLIETLARAVQAAHEQHIVHRDLKPANVLFRTESKGLRTEEKLSPQSSVLSTEEVLSPVISDFGLAKKLDEVGRTASGAVMGTPPYMAPEQARGDSQAIGPAADVYALGAVLYECLTGHPPFKAATSVETLRQVAENEPVPPRQLQPDLPRDLETVCLKCLHKSPARRYASAAALADELRRFLDGRPILARPTRIWERGVKCARRQPLAASLLGLVGLVTLVGITAVTLAWRRAEAEAGARRAANGAEAEQRWQLDRQLYFAHIALADRELRAGKPAWARHWLDQCPAELRHWEWHYPDRHLRGQAVRTWEGHEGGIGWVAFNPRGTVLATAAEDGSVGLWRADVGKLVHRLTGHKGSVNCLSFAGDGRHLASGGADGLIILWRVSDGRPWKRLTGHEQSLFAVAYHPAGRFLASATFDLNDPGQVWLWDVNEGKPVRRFTGHTSRITGLAYSPDGRWLASSSHDGTVRVLEGTSLEPARTFDRHAFPVSAVAFGPDGLVASAAGRLVADRPDEGEVLVWKAHTGEILHRLKGHSRRPMTLAFSPDGRRLATAGWDGDIKLWDVSTGQEVLAMQGARDGVLGVAFSPDGRFLAAGGMDGSVTLRDAAARP